MDSHEKVVVEDNPHGGSFAFLEVLVVGAKGDLAAGDTEHSLNCHLGNGVLYFRDGIIDFGCVDWFRIGNFGRLAVAATDKIAGQPQKSEEKQ